MTDQFERDLVSFLNHHGIDSRLNLPDFIVAKHLLRFIDLIQDLDKDFVNYYDGANNQQLFEDMDGDHASALASVGWGVDEDYGDGERI